MANIIGAVVRVDHDVEIRRKKDPSPDWSRFYLFVGDLQLSLDPGELARVAAGVLGISEDELRARLEVPEADLKTRCVYCGAEGVWITGAAPQCGACGDRE